MTLEFPDRDERAKAEALDAALDRGPQAQRRAGPSSGTDNLADLAASLRAVMPMPDLPTGGRTEVRAAAFAARGAKRRYRARLLVAAAVTLVIGAVGGAALSSAVQQPGPATNQAAVQVDLDYASGYLAKHNSAEARRYIERASKAILGKAPGPLATHPTTASEVAAIDALRQDLAVQTERASKLEAQNARLSKALGSMGRTAQGGVPVVATGSTTTTTTAPRHTAITARTSTTPTSGARSRRYAVTRLRPRHGPPRRSPRRRPRPRRRVPRRRRPQRRPRPPRQLPRCQFKRCRCLRRSRRLAPEASARGPPGSANYNHRSGGASDHAFDGHAFDHHGSNDHQAEDH